MKKVRKKGVSVLLAFITVFSIFSVLSAEELSAEAASWNGTNYGGGVVYGSKTFLEAYGIDYNVYMKWLDDHDDDSPNKDYYLGTPYVGYDHRNPKGDCNGTYGALDKKGVAAMNCTGFVWHVLYKAAKLSGASQSQINEIPVMGQSYGSWSRNNIYRIYFKTKEEALRSGVLEKGDVLWIEGSKDNHNAIFYGDNSSHDLFWHSAGKKNSLAPIKSAGTFYGMYVLKVTKPDKQELHIEASASGAQAGFGAKYCLFDNKSYARAAAGKPAGDSAWDKRKGTIVTDSSGYGCFREEGAPKNAQLWINGKAQTNLRYFQSEARKVSAKSTYYAVQQTSPSGADRDSTVYEFKDSGRRTSTGYRIFSDKPKKTVGTPQLTALESTKDGIKLSWNAVKGADKYRLFYRNKKGGWTRLGDTASTSFTDKAVSVGTTYVYTIRCIDSDGEYISSYNSAGWSCKYTGIETPQITELESTAQGVKIIWSKVDGAYQYRVFYKNKKGGWTRLGDTASTFMLDSDVRSGATYTYTVRCVGENGKYISGYNSAGSKIKYEIK